MNNSLFSGRVRVKICGNRSLQDVNTIVQAGVDAVGLIVGTKYFSEDEISISKALEMADAVPPFVSTVLVTHLQTSREILSIYHKIRFSEIQLHNDIQPSEIALIRDSAPHARIIKAVHVADWNALDVARSYEDYSDGILLDSRTVSRIGGTGQVHDWSISKEIVRLIRKPIILAGGLNEENVLKAIQFVRPFGVDVNSGVDSSCGDKDEVKVRKFIHKTLEAITS
jgi:phosphoribosylanthranilate isomerase